MKLLIAEDDATSRMMLTAVAKNWGFDVTAVEDGEAAWDIMQSEDAPKLLLLDWEMPKMDGIEVCQKVRQSEKNNTAYIIIRG